MWAARNGGSWQRFRSSRLRPGKFVAAHPIAGSENSGAEHASATLLDEKSMVLTPTDQTDANQLEKAEHFWRLTGGETRQMSPPRSTTPTWQRSATCHTWCPLWSPGWRIRKSRPLVGSGWQDITRVAAGDPTLWTAICQENRAAIRQRAAAFSSELDRLLPASSRAKMTRR